LRDVAVGVKRPKRIAVAQLAVLEEFSFHSLPCDCSLLRGNPILQL
jgi:hypothetical protein